MRIVADRNIPYVREAFGEAGQLDLLASAAIDADAVRNADALLVRTEVRVDRKLLEGSSVTFVGTATIGADHVDAGYLGERGICWTNAPGSNADAVKEYVLAALTHLAGAKSVSLQGMTLGIVGVGNIGSRVAKVARAWGMQVLLNDPPLYRSTGDTSYLPLDALMDADIITIHIPLTSAGPDATFHLFDAYRLRAMKRGSILLNTSRGAVVDNQVLREVLESGHLGGVVLDVWEKEPMIDTALLRKVDLGTPHIAGYSLEGKARATAMLYDALCAHFRIPPRWKMASALPAVTDHEISVNEGAGDPEAIVAEIVKECYPILRDDASLRAMLDVPAEHCKEFFTRLRTGYAFRREFANRTVRIASGNEPVAAMLRAAGLNVLST
jgi:erythronate-4-phosphate dehydrogenase